MKIYYIEHAFFKPVSPKHKNNLIGSKNIIKSFMKNMVTDIILYMIIKLLVFMTR